MDRVLVTGGTGKLGTQVVAALKERGATTRAMTRNRFPLRGRVSGDLATGRGIAEAVRGVDTIVHCATHPRYRRVDVDGTRWLLKAARGDGVKHIVYISIVGIDDNPFPYYQAKRRAERLIEESGIPCTVLRATQFHELVVAMADAVTKLPIAPVPKDVGVQPVDVEAVAQRLAELAAGEPIGRARDLGGPQVLSVAEAVHAYGSVVDRRFKQLQVPVPGKTGAAFRAGANLLGTDGEVVGESFSHHLVWKLAT